MINNIPKKAGLGYRLYKKYIHFFHNHLFYKNVYYINKENLPPLGEPTMIVSNHQNCANDPIAILMGLEPQYRAYTIARGDVFGWNPLVTKFWYWLGMLPAYRLNYEGAEALANNAETIRISGGKLLEGHRLIMYPEGTHQNKRWLGDFSFGYTRLAFETAEADGFQHDIKILPTANHYSSYFGIQEDVLIRFGTPISLKDYYEQYKEKPRTTQRIVNKLVREQILSLMLNISDLEHYDAIDWLRESEFGTRYSIEHKKNPKYLPEKQEADKLLVTDLEQLMQNDKSTWDDICTQIGEISHQEKQLGITNEQVLHPWGASKICLSLLCQVLLFPLWLVSLYPNGIHYWLPKAFLKTDKMFTNSLLFIIPIVIGIPLFSLLTLLVMGLVWGLWWQALVWILLFYPLAFFGYLEGRWMKKTWRNLKVLFNKGKVNQLRQKTEQVFNKIKSII